MMEVNNAHRPEPVFRRSTYRPVKDVHKTRAICESLGWSLHMHAHTRWIYVLFLIYFTLCFTSLTLLSAPSAGTGEKKKCKLKWPNFSCLSVSVNKKSESDEEENFYSTLAWPSLLWQQTGLTFTIKQQCSSFYSGYHISRKQGLELSELQIPVHLIF